MIRRAIRRHPAAAVAAALAISSCAPSQSPVAQTGEKFITARGNQLFEGDEPYRFLSFNVPNLHYIEDDMRFAQPMPFRWPSEYEVRDAFDSIRQMGGRVVRIYALSVRKPDDPRDLPRHVLAPGEFDERGFEALDMVLDIARTKGVRVIIPLVDNWSWWGGVAEYAAFRGKQREEFWTDPELIEDYKRTARFVIERVNTRSRIAYRDDPTILAWETGNELDCPPDWTAEIADFIQRLDPNHLVIDGLHQQVLRQESIDDPNIDLLQTHHYEKDPRDMIANIRRSADMARGRKPYHVGEFGFLTTAGMTAVMDTIVEEGLAGGLVWSLRFHNRDGGFYWHSEPHGGDVFKAYHWPGFASGEPYDETRLLRELRRRAFAMRGIRDPERGSPAAPVIVDVAPGGQLTWRGSAGANAYDVQRAKSPEGPWRNVGTGISDAATQYRPLFTDQSVVPGETYWYRVVARNDAGRSAPTEPFGPATMTRRTLVDELWNDSRLFVAEGRLEFRRDNARRFKEDSHGLECPEGCAVIYRTDDPILDARIWAFAESDIEDLDFGTSADGRTFSPVAARAESMPRDVDASAYGYWRPVRFRLDDLQIGVRYLRIEFSGTPIRATRVEIEYGG
jgi:hypothetical protein